MKIIMDIIAIIGITLLIIDHIVSFYKVVMNNDKKVKLRAVIQLIVQGIMLYGGYRIISFLS